MNWSGGTRRQRGGGAHLPNSSPNSSRGIGENSEKRASGQNVELGPTFSGHSGAARATLGFRGFRGFRADRAAQSPRPPSGVAPVTWARAPSSARSVPVPLELRPNSPRFCLPWISRGDPARRPEHETSTANDGRSAGTPRETGACPANSADVGNAGRSDAPSCIGMSPACSVPLAIALCAEKSGSTAYLLCPWIEVPLAPPPAKDRRSQIPVPLNQVGRPAVPVTRALQSGRFRPPGLAKSPKTRRVTLVGGNSGPGEVAPGLPKVSLP